MQDTPTPTPATPSHAPVTRGRVIFVGTGPGDPDLLTLGAIAALADAGAVVLDDERQREILAHPAITLAVGAEVSILGLSEARRPLTPSARAKIVVKLASTGSRVVRLVTGDPFWDNAVAEEAAACVRGGIDFEVVPGVSSLTAVPEYAGIDLIHSGGVQFASITDGRFTKASTGQWGGAATVVVSTLVSMVGSLVDAAKAAGRPGDDHVIVTLHGGSTEQVTLPTTLDDVVAAVKSAKAPGADPVHVIMGAAAEQRHEL
ncbi:MAG: Uroporphyrinogen methyltransferase / synthase, partial [Friedmanniella sp.]|nr:Uroporphyrinogen methyltransferase / synthase [Friedmanniella sp.]